MNLQTVKPRARRTSSGYWIAFEAYADKKIAKGEPSPFVIAATIDDAIRTLLLAQLRKQLEPML